MRIKCVVSYNGTAYYGWQRQSNHPSLQETIETAIMRLHKSPVSIFASGRTDTHVHAIGQVFHFDTPLNISCEAWKKALNTLLPDDICIQDVAFVDNDFHARRSAIGKHYRFVIEQGPYDVFSYQTCLQVNRTLNIETMREASRIFVGEHDFTSFAANPLTLTENQVRTIYQFNCEASGTRIICDIYGNGFLRYMVRRIIAALIKVGKGVWTIDKVQGILDAKDKHALGLSIDGCGLYLVEVFYQQEKLLDALAGKAQI